MTRTPDSSRQPGRRARVSQTAAPVVILLLFMAAATIGAIAAPEPGVLGRARRLEVAGQVPAALALIEDALEQRPDDEEAVGLLERHLRLVAGRGDETALLADLDHLDELGAVGPDAAVHARAAIALVMAGYAESALLVMDHAWQRLGRIRAARPALLEIDRHVAVAIREGLEAFVCCDWVVGHGPR